ncbi:otoraplin-like [Platichthys flesus]|uniref:otoraplin-like n=1 Tax=Platichthys flesus TaxID=8260 RepID=UPI002DB76E62|nr:otoraplin-like [Platichthys flesus]
MQGLSPSTPGWEKCLETYSLKFLQPSTFTFAHTYKTLCCLVSMNYPLVILLCVGLLHQTVRAVVMDKLADNKICGEAECSYVLSMATALDDFIAPDCRFINIKKGQMVYVYSKLVPEEGAGVFWSGSVYGDRYVDQMGIIGYFPATVVKETHKFTEVTVKIPTTGMDFYCV